MEDLKYISEIFLELKSTSSINKKKEFLLRNQYNEDFKFCLKYLLDSSLIIGINKKKLEKEFVYIKHLNISSFKDLIAYLIKNNTGSNDTVAICNTFITNCRAAFDNETADFITEIICKSFKCGVDAKIVNSIYGKSFIKTFDVQLGISKDGLKLKDNEIFYLTQKLNGIRGVLANGKMFSRQGHEICGLNHIINALPSNNFIYDGELIRRNTDNIPDNENFRLTAGIVNSDSEYKSEIDFIIFDIVDSKGFFEKGESAFDYSERRKELDLLDKYLKLSKIDCVKVLPLLYSGTDKSEIDKWLNYADTHNWEGIMLNKDVPYYCKRHNGLVKIKSFKHSDLQIVGFKEGTGKNLGTLGAFSVKYKGNIVDVGSGLTDEQRKTFWEIRDTLLNKFIQVKYKEETQDKTTKEYSLQFPVFECLRLDKAKESIE